MNTVTISKKEYETLLMSKYKYEYLKQILNNDLFTPPPTKNVDTIVKAFAETGTYNKEFLESLQKGLKRSSHFKGK